jgi:thioredoxin 1
VVRLIEARVGPTRWRDKALESQSSGRGQPGGRPSLERIGLGRPRWLCAKIQSTLGEFPMVHKASYMSSELIKHVTDASFDADVMKSATPVLVDYWAEWCGPCKMIAPILEETAKDYGARLQIAKMNVDENRDIPSKFGIRGIPTLMLFKDGQLAATKVGALSKAQLTAFLASHL